MNGERGAPTGQAYQQTNTIKNNDKDKLPFLCGWHRVNTFLPLSVSVVQRRWCGCKEEGEGGGLPWEGLQPLRQRLRDEVDLPSKS